METMTAPAPGDVSTIVENWIPEIRMATVKEILNSQNPKRINKGAFRLNQSDGSYTYCRLGILLEEGGFDWSTVEV